MHGAGVIVLTSAATVVVIALAVLAVALARMLARLRALVARVEAELVPLIEDAKVAIDRAETDRERVERLLATTASIQETVDAASRLAYGAFSNPVIKTVAFGAGTQGALRRLRKGR